MHVTGKSGRKHLVNRGSKRQNENDIPRPVKAGRVVDTEQSRCSTYNDYSRDSREVAYLVCTCRIEDRSYNTLETFNKNVPPDYPSSWVDIRKKFEIQCDIMKDCLEIIIRKVGDTLYIAYQRDGEISLGNTDEA